jgi:hypothetical protein
MAAKKITDVVTTILSSERMRARLALRPIAEAVFTLIPGCPKVVVTERMGEGVVVIDIGSCPDQFRTMLSQALESVRPIGFEFDLRPLPQANEKLSAAE